MSPTAEERSREVLGAAVVRILRPLVRILLRHGVPFGAFADLAKRVYVDVAAAEFQVGKRKQTVSRIAVLTGLTRKEVRRVADLPEPSAEEETKRYSRAARVISGWTSDARFVDDKGDPRPLDVDAGFTDLVRSYSGDMPVRAVLDELLRVGSVERDTSGAVRLRTRAYVPATAGADTLEILGADVSALAATIDHNMTCAPETRWIQRKVLYDNLPAEALPALRALTAKHGQQLLELINAAMREQDRDCNPDAKGSGRHTAMVGVWWNDAVTAGDSEGEPS